MLRVTNPEVWWGVNSTVPVTMSGFSYSSPIFFQNATSAKIDWYFSRSFSVRILASADCPGCAGAGACAAGGAGAWAVGADPDPDPEGNCGTGAMGVCVEAGCTPAPAWAAPSVEAAPALALSAAISASGRTS